jgi:hypothetical protein
MAADVESETFVSYGARDAADVLGVGLQHDDPVAGLGKFIGCG